MNPDILIQAAAPVAESAPMAPEVAISWAIALFALAAALAVIEFLVVSWGMLLVGSAISALAAIALAFQVGPAAGWTFVAITPVLGFFVLRTGFALMKRNSAAVLPTEISADAGAHHTAEKAGVAVGAVGELVTNAYPTGRARFSGHGAPVELDVQVQGAVLSRGDRVVVLVISGPVITVGAAPDSVSTLLNQNPPQGT